MIELLPDMTLFYQWLMFLIVLTVLTFGVFRPALRIIEARRSATDGDEAAADELEHTAAALSERVEASLQQARTHGHEIIAELRQEAEGAAAQTLQQARDTMDQELKAVRGRLEQQAREVELQLKQQAQDLSSDLATRILGRKVGSA